jgi:hypothetical protein
MLIFDRLILYYLGRYLRCLDEFRIGKDLERSAMEASESVLLDKFEVYMNVLV